MMLMSPVEMVWVDASTLTGLNRLESWDEVMRCGRWRSSPWDCVTLVKIDSSFSIRSSRSIFSSTWDGRSTSVHSICRRRLDVMRFWLKMLIDLRSPCVHYDLCGHLILYYLYVYVTISVVTLYYTISMCTWRFLWLPLTRILLTIAIESVSDAGCDGFSLLKLSKQKLSGDERTEKISTPQKRSRRICFLCNDLIISSAPMLKSLLITSNMSLYISVLKMWINFVLTKYKIS